MVQQILTRPHGNNVFSVLDLKAAYHQVPMAEDSIEKTAIITPWGLYEYVVMPFGLKNASQTFQRYINSIFRDLNFVEVYIDDIMVMSQDIEKRKQHLKEVFERLRQHSLYLNVNKCQLGQPTVTFLGYTINAEGFAPTTERIHEISNYPKPETIHELRRFLGKINYYRRSVPRAAHLQQPLVKYLITS